MLDRGKVGQRRASAAARSVRAPSCKACKRMCVFLMVAIAAPMQKKVHSVPCSAAKHGRAAADGGSLGVPLRRKERRRGRRRREVVRDACCVAAKCVYKRRRASRLAFKSFLRGRRFLKLPPDFLLRCGRFDRLRWQLVFGTFLFGANTVRKDTNHQPPPLLLLPLPLGHQQEPHLCIMYWLILLILINRAR